MKYKVIVYYDNMPDSEHIFSNKNDAINEIQKLKNGFLHRKQNLKDFEHTTPAKS